MRNPLTNPRTLPGRMRPSRTLSAALSLGLALSLAFGLTFAGTGLQLPGLQGPLLPAAHAEEVPPGNETAPPPTSIEKRVLASEHADVVAVSLQDGKLLLDTRADVDGELAKPLRAAETIIHVADTAQVQLGSDPSYAFLGAAGKTVWLVPQTRNPQVVWAGFSTENEPLRAAASSVSLELVSAQGPGPVEIYTQGDFGATPQRLFSSTTKLPAWQMQVPQHSHANWVFSEPGVYKLRFAARAAIAGAEQLAEQTYTFVVGELEKYKAEANLVDQPGTGDTDTGGTDAGVGAGDGSGSAPGAEDGTAPAPGETASGTPATPPATTPAPAPATPAVRTCAPAVTLATGHVDLFNVSAGGGAAVLQVKEDVTGSHVLREAETVLLRVHDNAFVPNIPAGVPGGPSGYVLPLTQRADIVWPGWDTNRTARSGYTDVSIHVTGVRGPGAVYLYSQGTFGGVQPLLTHGGYRLPGSLHESTPAHTHAQWVFTQAGVYVLTAHATATNPATGQSLTTAAHNFVFQVGNVPLGDVFCGMQASGAGLSAAVNAAVDKSEREALAAAQQKAAEKAAQEAAEKAAAAKKQSATLAAPKSGQAGAVSGAVDAGADGVTVHQLWLLGGAGVLLVVAITGFTLWRVRKLRTEAP